VARYNNILNVEEVSSTNVYLFSLLNAENAQNISVVTAEFQTAGKGQQGNSWHSERGRNLLFSHAVFPHALAANNQFIISQIVALALCKTLQSYGIDACIKWANDIYVGDKKIAGVLIENQLRGNVVSTAVIGIGLNVNQTDFPQFLPNPTSMACCTQQNFDRKEVLEHYLQNFDALASAVTEITGKPVVEALEVSVHNKEQKTIHNKYMINLYRYKTPARFADADGEFEGTIVDVEPSGKLIIRHAGGSLRSYYFKEVKFIV
jgi:BirA family biotin operon repressor/biotin-[acetyl-CoA-carboxylase] ligase